MASIRIGTQSWTSPYIKAALYPNAKPAERLSIMAAMLSDAVEADGTWHSVPAISSVESWRASTPAEFVFAVKMHKSITHEKMLTNTERETDAFLSIVKHLDRKLGVVLLQFSDNFHSGYFKPLEGYLGKLPTDVRFAIEIRSQSWLQPGTIERYLDLLRTFNVAHVISDSWGVAYGEHLTTDFAYIRLNGNDVMPDSDRESLRRVIVQREKELDRWSEVIQRFATQVDVVYCFVNDCFEHSAVESVRSLQQRLGIVVSHQELPKQLL